MLTRSLVLARKYVVAQALFARSVLVGQEGALVVGLPLLGSRRARSELAVERQEGGDLLLSRRGRDGLG